MNPDPYPTPAKRKDPMHPATGIQLETILCIIYIPLDEIDHAPIKMDLGIVPQGDLTHIILYISCYRAIVQI